MSIVLIFVGVVIAVPLVAVLIKVCAGAPKKAKKGERAEIMRQLLAQSEHENGTSAIASHPVRPPSSSVRSDTSRRGPSQVQNSKGKHLPTSPNPSTSRKPNRVDAEIEERIRQRAYELYQERGGVGGDPTDDWEQAKKDVLSSKAKAATASS
jgi:hypothetical protein